MKPLTEEAGTAMGLCASRMLDSNRAPAPVGCTALDYGGGSNLELPRGGTEALLSTV